MCLKMTFIHGIQEFGRFIPCFLATAKKKEKCIEFDILQHVVNYTMAIFSGVAIYIYMYNHPEVDRMYDF